MVGWLFIPAILGIRFLDNADPLKIFESVALTIVEGEDQPGRNFGYALELQGFGSDFLDDPGVRGACDGHFGVFRKS